MSESLTERGQLPSYGGSDPPAGMTQQANLVARLAEIALFFDQGAYAALSTSLAANTARKGWMYYATDGAAWFWCDGTAWHLVAAETPLLTAVPTALFDGQRFAYRPDDTNQPSVRWTFERQGGQWLLIAGAPLVGRITNDLPFTNGPYVSTKVTGAALPIGLAGLYRIRGAARSWFVNGQGEIVVARNNGTALTSPVKPFNGDNTAAYPLIPAADGVSLASGDSVWFWTKTYNTGNNPQLWLGAASYFDLLPIRVTT